MTTTRRGLFKALGLGAVGLATGGNTVADMIQEEKNRLALSDETDRSDKTIKSYDESKPISISKWEHPDLDKIEAILKLTGGYPNFWAPFNKELIVNNGDSLNIDYRVTCLEREIVLYRVYDVVSNCCAIGTSIQGPIVEDLKEPSGHRLATLEELRPNEEASRAFYLDIEPLSSS